MLCHAVLWFILASLTCLCFAFFACKYSQSTLKPKVFAITCVFKKYSWEQLVTSDEKITGEILIALLE